LVAPGQATVRACLLVAAAIGAAAMMVSPDSATPDDNRRRGVACARRGTIGKTREKACKKTRKKT
jgi:hypothetical protein